jgi:acetyl esterase/lipase
MFPHENPAVDRRVRDFLKSAYEQSQAAGPQPALDFATMTYEQTQGAALTMDAMFTRIVESVIGGPPEGAAPPEHMEIDGVDGHRVPIDIFRPKEPRKGPLPGIVYCHGGGMAFVSAETYRPILQRMADAGAVVIAPHFRNSPIARFPAGVHDCLSAVLWARASMASLGIHGVTIAGESGGGCLALTVPLVALRRGLDPAELLDGVWADGPMCYSDSDAAGSPLRSHVENNGYVLTMDMLQLMRRLYIDDPKDPCAFPFNAPEEALRRFPRTTIVVYEFDPLRDEGIALYRKMVAAGHPDVDCMQVHGLTHCSMLSWPLKPEFSSRQLQRLVTFAS